MENLEPNFSLHSRFNPRKGFTGVKYGANAKLLEVELNEMQDMLSHSQRQLTRSMYPNGLFEGSNISFENGVLKLDNTVAVVDGDIIEIAEATMSLNASHVGQTVYLRKSFQVVTHNDPIREFGNLDTAITVPNDMLDDRYNKETSRRIQLQYTLTRSNPELPNTSYLELGRVSTPAREETGTGTNTIFVSTVLVFIPLWMFQGSFYIDGGSFSDEYTRLIDGGYFHEDSQRVLDGGEF